MSLSDWNPDPMQRVATAIERMAERQDRFYTEVLDLLGRITEDPQSGPDGSLHSGQPAAAPDGQEGGEPRACRVCGKEGVWIVCTDEDAPLTRKQWFKHHDRLYYDSQEHGANKMNACDWADSQMENTFGPCPEES